MTRPLFKGPDLITFSVLAFHTFILYCVYALAMWGAAPDVFKQALTAGYWMYGINIAALAMVLASLTILIRSGMIPPDLADKIRESRLRKDVSAFMLVLQQASPVVHGMTLVFAVMCNLHVLAMLAGVFLGLALLLRYTIHKLAQA